MPKKNPYKNSEIKQDGGEIPEVEKTQDDEIGNLLDKIKQEPDKETYMTLVDRIRVDAESKKEFVLNFIFSTICSFGAILLSSSSIKISESMGEFFRSFAILNNVNIKITKPRNKNAIKHLHILANNHKRI